MKKLTQLLQASAFLAFLAISLLAQENHVMIDSVGSRPPSTIDPRSVYLELVSLVEHGFFDQKAAAVLAGAEKSTQAIFDLQGLSLTAKGSYRDDGGDNVVALWNFDSDLGSGTIVLRDTPYFSTYALQVRRPSVITESDVERLLSSILHWNRRPLNLQTVKLAHQSTPSSLRVSFERLGSTFEPASLISLVAASRGGECWVTLKVGKGLIADFYPNDEFLPERFPPLEQLVKEWSDERLWSEISAPRYRGEALRASEFRDRLITTEIAKRGLVTAKIIELLEIETPYGYAHRAVVTTGALELLHPGWAGSYLQGALDLYERVNARDAALVVAAAAARHCNPQSEAISARMIGSQTVGPAAANYLMTCSNSPAILFTLKEMMAAGRLEEADRFLLKRMETRITTPGTR